MHYVFLFLFYFSPFISSCYTYSCQNERGDPVDWFVLYKIPKISHSKVHIADGLGYMYITSNNNNGWTVSDIPINESSSMLGMTISDMYSKHTEDSLWIAYNDQSLESATWKGHTKGIIGAQRNGGFWLVHSIPHFPTLPVVNYTYPETGIRNGQSALCISTSNIDEVGHFLQYNNPYISYNVTFPKVESIFPALYSALGGKLINHPPWYYTNELISKAGNHFKVFSKAKQFNKDLYEWVATVLNLDLLAETWRNEPHPLSSDCSHTNRVMNIEDIMYTQIFSFSSHKDHSKWAVSVNATSPWICIGDINRAEPQFTRGGGTVCLEDEKLWTAYSQLVKDVEPCKKNSTS